MKRPFEKSCDFKTRYNFTEYFTGIIEGKEQTLKNSDEFVRISPECFENWEEFAKVIAWYGRKNGRSTYIKEVFVEME